MNFEVLKLAQLPPFHTHFETDKKSKVINSKRHNTIFYDANRKDNANI